MKTINKLKAYYLVILAGLFLITSCNKDLEQFAAIPKPVYPTGNGIAATLAANPNYSNYAALIARGGLTATLNDSTKSYTIFATDNNGMNLFATSASGGLVPYPAPVATVLGFINTNVTPANAAGIVMYHTVGTKFPASAIGTGFPNFPLTSQIILDPTQPFVRMPIFPSRVAATPYVNTLPLIATDMAAANGIIHTAYSIVSPLPASPLVTLRTLINADANLTYFKAAIARGDSGQVGISGVGAYGLQFDSLMNYPVTNMTVLAPNNAAFQTLIFGLVYAQVFAATGSVPIATAQANGAVALGPGIFSNPAFYGSITAATVRGIVAYHIMASKNTGSFKPDIRAFSVNFTTTPGTFPSTTGYVSTLVNGSLATHPGIKPQATFTAGVVTALKFTGLGTFPPGGGPYSGIAANATSWDRMALNGVLHVIDNVLLPQ